ncbi:MAG: porin family protein [Bacteroidota bacterium]
MRKFLLLCTFVVLTLASQAQNRDIRFGFQASPTFSTLSTNDNKINRNGTNLGMKLGMIGEYYFRPNYSFFAGIGFHFNAGGELQYDAAVDSVAIWREVDLLLDEGFSFAGETSFDYSLQYIEIPFGMHFYTREYGQMRFMFEPSLSLGIRTQSRGNVVNDRRFMIDQEEDFDIRSAVNPFNLAWGILAAVEYNVGSNTNLVGGIGFQSGISDVTKDKNTEIMANGRTLEEDSKGTINNIVIRLGIMF